MSTVDLLDRPIAYHRVFVELTHSVKAAVMLSQAVYWQKRAKQKDGWWYKTAEEWEEETGLSRHEQDTARKQCEKYLKSDLRDVPARLYWKIDESALSADLIAISGQSSLPESGKLDSRKQTNINRNAETTTETTTETTEREAPPPAPPQYDFENMTVQEARKVPTLRMFKKATGIFPGDILWQFVHNFITENQLTEKQIRETAVIWSARGWNRYNVQGILERARDGWDDKPNGHKPPLRQQDREAILREVANA